MDFWISNSSLFYVCVELYDQLNVYVSNGVFALITRPLYSITLLSWDAIWTNMVTLSYNFLFQNDTEINAV